MSNKQDKIFIIVLSIFALSILLWFPIKHVLISKGYIDFVITSNWVFYEKTQTSTLGKIDDFIEEKKTNLQNRITNYFPFYESLNKSFYSLVIDSNKIFYKNDFPVSQNPDKEYVFYNDDHNFYYIRNNRGKEDLEKKVNNQIDFFNSLYESNSNVNLNIYLVPRFEQTSLPKNNLNKHTNTFKEKINENINIAELEIKDEKDYINKFYKTDHHWNMYGAYEGYQDIMNMLGKSPNEFTIERVGNTKYYGSLAKVSLSTLTFDNIYDIKETLDYEIEINGVAKDVSFKPRKITYKNGYKFFDYYIHYFNGQYGLLKYTFNNDSNENLLIFSDSYAWQIDYLIASHYKNTYVVNLRYDEYKNGTINYNKFIEENNIKDVLFLYEGSSTIFDQYDYGFDNKIVRDK